MKASLPLLAVIAAFATAPAALAQESPHDPVAEFARHADDTRLVIDAGPVRPMSQNRPADTPPSLDEQVRKLLARLDNAYPDAPESRKWAFIADYLGVDPRRLWNAYHPDRPDRPDLRPDRPDVRPDRPHRPEVRPARERPVAIRPARIQRDRPVRPRG